MDEQHREHKSEAKTVTWIHLGIAFGALLLAIIAQWVNVNANISAMGQYIDDNKESQKIILQSIENLRTTQMSEIEKLGELKGALDYQLKNSERKMSNQ